MKPQFIRPGSSIYLVAPSFGATTYPYRERLEISIQFLRARGYRIIEGPNIWLDQGVVGSNSPQARAQEIELAFSSEADIIWSVGGGETMNEIIPYIDFERLKSYPPKYFIGYSDNTNLGYLLQTLLDYPTIYGPCAGSFYAKEAEKDRKQIIEIIEGQNFFQGYPMYQSLAASKQDLNPPNLDTPKEIIAYNYTSPLQGVLIGGCLDCLITLCGTRFDQTKEYLKKHDQVIFFLEACDLNVLSYRRALFQLREAGWFTNVQAILIGRPLHIGENLGSLSFNQDALDILGPLRIPLILDIDIGHLPPVIPLRTNELCEIKYDANNIFIRYYD